jgi:broad specificity phosphatase PhoE
MSDCLWLLRHADTEWTEAGRHTGRRDLPLSQAGREQARGAGRLLTGRRFATVLVSPQRRALETCELAGFGSGAKQSELLAEWDYGDYEGLTDEETQARAPGWDLFRDGGPGGETPADVARRLDELLQLVGGLEGPCLLVGHGKAMRALAARWLGLAVAVGAALAMEPASISILDREGDQPLVRLWNLRPDRASL